MLQIRRLCVLVVTGSALISSVHAKACLWDYDTLRDEKRGLPGIAEVLAGKWERHSRFFYQQRVLRMKALIAREPGNLAACDNLAVAFEKLDDRDSAIDVMNQKERIKPGEYTTYANVGTFYLHKGDFDNGILYIRKALQINPNAHFGREEYQLRLAEFLREGQANPRLLRATDFLLIRDGKVVTMEEARKIAETGLPELPRLSGMPDLTDPDDFYARPDAAAELELPAYRGYPDGLRDAGFKDNVLDGIVGMIRFGTGTSAELYLTLGDLLVMRGDKNLAYRAYQRALDLHHPRKHYLEAMMKGLSEMIYDTNSIQPGAIARDRADADAWVKSYQDYEDQLLREGKDVDDEANYAEFYRKLGPAKLADPFRIADYWNPKHLDAVLAIVLITVISFVVALFVMAKWWARRRRSKALAVPK